MFEGAETPSMDRTFINFLQLQTQVTAISDIALKNGYHFH